MENEPKKRFYQDNNRNFIDYSGKQSMIIEVFDFKNSDEAFAFIREKEIEFERIHFPSFMSMTSWDGRLYVLVAIELRWELQERTQQFADKMAKLMRRLADWYRYAVLNAQAN